MFSSSSPSSSSSPTTSVSLLSCTHRGTRTRMRLSSFAWEKRSYRCLGFEGKSSFSSSFSLSRFSFFLLARARSLLGTPTPLLLPLPLLLLLLLLFDRKRRKRKRKNPRDKMMIISARKHQLGADDIYSSMKCTSACICPRILFLHSFAFRQRSFGLSDWNPSLNAHDHFHSDTSVTRTMCNLALISPTASPSGSTDSIASSSMHSPKQNPSIDEQHQQDLNPDNEETKVGPRTTTPSSLAGTRSDVDSPFRSYAVIETDPTELDRIIDVLRQFFPNTRIVECNNQSSNPSRTPSRSSLVAAPQQQTSIESTSSLRVPNLGSNRYRSHSHSTSDKSSFDSDILQPSPNVPVEAITVSPSDAAAAALNPNSQVNRKQHLVCFHSLIRSFV